MFVIVIELNNFSNNHCGFEGIIFNRGLMNDPISVQQQLFDLLGNKPFKLQINNIH